MYKAELEEIIQGVARSYFGLCAREYGNNSACRGAFLLADNPPDYWVHHVLVADLIIKNENRTWSEYIPLIEESVNAVLSRKSECELSSEDWEKIIEIAERVKENLPNIKVIPEGEEDALGTHLEIEKKLKKYKPPKGSKKIPLVLKLFKRRRGDS